MKLARDITKTIEKNRGRIWGDNNVSKKHLIILNNNYLGVPF